MTDTTLAASQARIATPKARGYLVQLCKHFAHKIPATFTDNRGSIQFGMRISELDAEDPDTLVIRTSASDDANLSTVEDVVERHLRRFAFKEDLAIQWVRT